MGRDWREGGMEKPVYVLPSLYTMESIPPGVTVSSLRFLLPPVLPSTMQKPPPQIPLSLLPPSLQPGVRRSDFYVGFSLWCLNFPCLLFLLNKMYLIFHIKFPLWKPLSHFWIPARVVVLFSVSFIIAVGGGNDSGSQVYLRTWEVPYLAFLSASRNSVPETFSDSGPEFPKPCLFLKVCPWVFFNFIPSQ